MGGFNKRTGKKRFEDWGICRKNKPFGVWPCMSVSCMSGILTMEENEGSSRRGTHRGYAMSKFKD